MSAIDCKCCLGCPGPTELRRLRQPAAAQIGPQGVIRQDEVERIGQCRGVQRIDQQRGLLREAVTYPPRPPSLRGKGGVTPSLGGERGLGGEVTSGRLDVLEQITGVPHAIASSTGRPKPS